MFARVRNGDVEDDGYDNKGDGGGDSMSRR